MAERVNPPTQLVLPPKVQADPQLKKAFDDIIFVVFQLWKRGGGSTDDLSQALEDIANIEAEIVNIKADVAANTEAIEANTALINDIPIYSAFMAQLQQIRREFEGLPEFTIDTSGFTTDLSFITTDKVIA